MPLPSDFQFSQGSLQDYADCPRRFQLRYLMQVDWPAPEAEPALENERHLQLGAAFHRLVHQHALGISPETLSDQVTDADLRRWWENYLARGPENLPPSRYPEITLSAPLGAHRLVAKYDLVAVEAGRRCIIVDWKTSRKRPRHEDLAGRLQTRVYPYLLVRAGDHLNGGRPLAPTQVEMRYWFTEYPSEPACFAYDEARYEADTAYLAALVEEIVALGDGDFPLTAREQRCAYCPYRSLCQRGVKAGRLDAMEDEMEADEGFDIALDFEQIAEIAY